MDFFHIIIVCFSIDSTKFNTLVLCYVAGTKKNNERKAEEVDASPALATIKRPRWSPEEKEAAKTCFTQFLTGVTTIIPPLKDIAAMKDTYPSLFINRKPASIKTWLCLNVNKF